MKISIHPSVYVYLISMFILSSWKNCTAALSALLVHELGHFAVSSIIGEKISKIAFTPFGGVIEYENGKSPCKGIHGVLTALGGPAANYLFLITADRIIDAFSDSELSCAMISANAVMMFINLLPALPMDGGRVAFSIGYYVFPVMSLISVLSTMGIVIGAGFVLLSVCGAIIYGLLNCSLVIVGGYLICCAWKSKEQMKIENLYAIIDEKMERNQEFQVVRCYKVPSGTQLIQLVTYFDQKHACEFIFENDQKVQRVTEKMVSKRLLDHPLSSIEDIFP